MNSEIRTIYTVPGGHANRFRPISRFFRLTSCTTPGKPAGKQKENELPAKKTEGAPTGKKGSFFRKKTILLLKFLSNCDIFFFLLYNEKSSSYTEYGDCHEIFLPRSFSVFRHFRLFVFRVF
ncbi:MAG: hypothetical protein J6Y92_03905 [Lentisphaeria bacterium]|nr:hypothetical protein [Lentisphaeria bacterium]